MAERTAPFVHNGDCTRFRMLDAAIALLPAVAGAIWFFRLNAILLLSETLACCLLLEWAAGKLRHRSSLLDGSALVTGLLLALLLPPDCPLWAVPLGATAAIVSKALAGGLGKNFLNPAALGRAVLLLLPSLRPAALRTAEGNFLMGYLDGSLGEAASLLLLAGAVYLAIRRLLPLWITPAYLIAAFFTGLALPHCDAAAVLAWGGTLLGAAFLSADPVTTPMGRWLQLLFGIACGVGCTLLAYYGWGIGGICCGILVVNFLCRAAEWAAWHIGL